MSKNMTRKGIALGAGIALAMTGLVAVPAQAAGELKLEAASGGAKYSVLHTSNFALKVSVNPGYDTNELTWLKWNIVSGGGFEVDAGEAATEALAVAAIADEKVAVGAASGNVAATWAAADGASSYFALTIDKLAADTNFAVTDDSKSVTVTAYIDKDGDGVVDTNEWQASQVITWKDSDLASVVNVLDTTRGNAPTSYLSSSDINLSQSKSVIDVEFTSSAPDTEKVVGSAATYSADDNELTYATNDVEPDGGAANSGVEVATAGNTYSSYAVIGAVKVSNTVTKTVAAATVDNVIYSAAATASTTALADGGGNINAKVGSGSIVLALNTQNGANDVVSSAVSVKVAENGATTLATSASVTFLGQTLTNTSAATVQSKTASVTTDAVLGEASVTISWTGAVKDDKLTVTLTGDGNAPSFTITFVEAAATTLHNTDVIGTAAELVVPAATNVTLNYVVLDQWGALFTAAGHTVQVNDDADAPVWSAAVVNGRAAVVIPGYAAGSTPGTMDAAVYKGGAAQGGVTTSTELTVGTEAAVASITIAGSYGTAGAPLNLNTKAFTAGDNRNGAADSAVNNEIADVAITVKDANGNATTSDVTFSGTDLLFSVDGIVWASGSVTVRTKADGTTAAGYVKISSNKAGKKTLTVTADGVSKTQSIYFKDAADDAGKTLTLNVPSNAVPGTTLRITGSLVDAFGNPVTADGTDEDFVLVYNGPGFAQTAPTAVSADGTFSMNVLIGANDTGTATVTAAYDLDEDGDYTDTGDLVVAKTVIIGSATGAGTVNVGSFNGKLVVYAKNLDGKRISWKVGGNWGKAVAVGNDLNRFDRLTPRKGVTLTVEIYVDGVKTLTKSVVTR
jgi:hypothetical protein